MWLNICVDEDQKVTKTETGKNMTKGFHPEIRETTNHKQDKHKENYTQLPHNQIAENIYLKKNS